MNSKLKKIIIFFIFILLVGTVLSFFKVKSITITGNQIYSEKEIERMLFESPFGRNSVYMYLKNRFLGFGTIPFIREIQIDWTSSKEVMVRVYEKSLVACFLYMGEYIYFDKDGIVLESSKTKIEGAPLIEGIPLFQFTLNEKMEFERESILNRILDLSQLIKHYKLAVDKITFNSKNEVTFLCNAGILVYLGDKEVYDQQIASLSSVLSKAIKNNLKGKIDLTNFEEGDKIILKQDK